MKDIKMIATDMDGTFLNDNYELSPDFFDVYNELKKRNILFVPASGRQMAAITKYFEPIKNELAFIAENGAYVIYKNEEVFVDKMQQEWVKKIISTVREISGAKLVVSAKEAAYYETSDQEFIDFFRQYYEKNKQVEDLMNVADENVLKIAVYHPEGSEKNLYPFLKEFEQHNLEVVVSGEFWLDIMNKNVNKGKALLELQQKLNISQEQTMAFGDYMNDSEMLKLAKYSYAMANAHPNVKAIANYEAPSHKEFGVVKVIKDFLGQI